MIKKPTGYDEAQAFDGAFEQLPPGGYICVIIKVEPTTTTNGKDAVQITYDIADGEYKNYFSRMYAADNRPDKTYRGTHIQATEDKSLSYFKGFITSVERSNSGFKFDWNNPENDKTLTKKLFGGVFGREQYKDKNGELKMSTKMVAYRSVEEIRKGIEPPKDKLVQTSTQSQNKPAPASYMPNAYQPYSNSPNFQEVSEDDLPF